MSREKQYSTDVIVKALEEMHGKISLAAEKVGCSLKTIERRAAEVQAVRDVIRKYEIRVTDKAELRLEKAIDNGEPWAITLQLTKSREGKSRGYAERTEQTGADGKDLQTIVNVYIPDNGRNNHD